MLTRVLKWLWEFVKYHKKKFIALLVTIGLGFGGFYLMKRALLQKLAEVGEMGKKMELRRRKELELARLRPECTNTVMSFLPPVRKQLNRLTDVVPITTKLRELRARQKQQRKPPTEDEAAEAALLWEDLKVNSLARLMCSIYSLTLLDLLLRVQLHVAAKRGLETDTATSLQVREEFMFKSTEYMVSTGLERLLQLTQQHIRSATKPWLMGTEAEVTKEEIVQRLQQTRKEIESQRTWFLATAVSPDDAQQQQGELKQLLDETYDLLESPNFASVLEQALDLMFDSLFEDLFQTKQFEDAQQRFILAKVIVGIKLFSKHILTTNESSSASAGEGEDDESVQTIVVSTAITNEGGVIVPDAPSNRYVKRLEAMPALEDLSRAILGLGAAGDETGGEFDDLLGDSMKDLLPLLQQMGGGGGANAGAGPDLASLLPLLQGGGGAAPPPVQAN